MIKIIYTLASCFVLIFFLHVQAYSSSKLDPKLVKHCEKLQGCLEVCIDEFKDVWKKLEEKYPRVKPGANGLSWTQFSCTWGCAYAHNLVPKCIRN